MDVGLHACLCSPCMPGAFRGQKEVLNSPGLELQMAVSYRVNAENQTWDF